MQVGDAVGHGAVAVVREAARRGGGADAVVLADLGGQRAAREGEQDKGRRDGAPGKLRRAVLQTWISDTVGAGLPALADGSPVSGSAALQVGNTAPRRHPARTGWDKARGDPVGSGLGWANPDG
ncbi:hypothetical protein CCR95_21975 [Thiocystis minor]|nr:hypothetical protein [Thiocystis minor]